MKGIPTLVTHLERGIHGSLLGLLIDRKIALAKDGYLCVHLGNTTFGYNPNFRLYLSASVHMDFIRTNPFVLPLHKAIVVNLAISQDSLRNHLISLTINSEKPELESQRRSLERDLSYLREEKQQIQVRPLLYFKIYL